MWVLGIRLFGSVLRREGSDLAPRCFHVCVLPLIGSVVVLQNLDEAEPAISNVPWHLPSLGLAYLRAGSAFVLLHGLLHGLEPGHIHASLYPMVAVLAAIGIVLGFFVFGRSRAEQPQSESAKKSALVNARSSGK